jgi:dTMP kinase
MNGLFLSLDGLDGTGKSTQCRLLVEHLRQRGLSLKPVVDPGGTPLGSKLREILLDKNSVFSARAEALLFMASRAELVESEIRPALEVGQIVVSDRYLLSTVVYQGHAGGLPVPELWQTGRLATGGIEPDLVLVLDLPVEQAILRRGREPDRMESKKLEYHHRVREGFRLEATQNPERIQLIDASASVDAIQAELRRRVEPLLARFS